MQVRAEFLDILLAVLCFTAPEIEGRLRQVGPGKGRAGAGDVAGAAQLFALAEGQPEAVRKVRGAGCWLLPAVCALLSGPSGGAGAAAGVLAVRLAVHTGCVSAW